MCGVITTNAKRNTNRFRSDPTRTGLIRRRFLAELRKRFRNLRGEIWRLVYEEDAFGLKPHNRQNDLFTGNVTTNTRWSFETDAGKVQKFQGWLQEQVNSGILSAPGGKTPDTPWTSRYIESSYMKGVKRAFTDSHNAAADAGLSFDVFEGGHEQFLDDAFPGKVLTSKIELLGTRTFEQLNGVSGAMGQELNRVFSDAIANGKGASETARMLNKSVQGIEKNRAATMARTELIHAHSEGQLDSFEALGVDEVGALAEWSTAEDGKVCPRCQPLEGAILTIKEARGIIPRHPNCRCTWIPAGVDEDTTGQKWAKDIIADDFRDSMKAETGLTDGKAARKKSIWSGADKKITDKGHLKPTKKNLEKKKLDLAAKKKAIQETGVQKAKDINLKLSQKAKAAARAKAKAKLIHSQKVKAGMAKSKIKTSKGFAEDDFFIPEGKEVISAKASALNTKMVQDELGTTLTKASQKGYIQGTPLTDTANLPLHEQVKYIEDLIPAAKAKKQFFDDHPVYPETMPGDYIQPDGTFTGKGVQAAFKDFPDKYQPTPEEIVKIAAINNFDEQADQIDNLLAKLGKQKADDEAAEAAAKAAQKKKIQEGMAKTHLKKKYGVTDEAINAPTPDSLKKQIAQGLGYDDVVDLVKAKAADQEKLTAFFVADDVVSIKDAAKALKKKPKPKKPPTPPPTPDTPDAPGGTANVPEPGELAFVRTLPGSTNPSLMEGPDGKRWVMKDTSNSLKPDHIRSEALADELYRRAGFAVPDGKLVDTAEGPSKITEFLEGGETLADWMRGKTKAQKQAMFDEISEGFVADALFANHDVAGLSYDNIFIHNGKPLRIDNGGALTFRAQGAPKRNFGPVVEELDTLRDRGINSVTAEIFGNVTQDDIHKQTRKLLKKKDDILGAVDGASLKKTLAARFDYLEGQLPAKSKPTTRQLGTARAVYNVDNEAAERIKKSRINGTTVSGDRDKIEDNNILVWEQEDYDGNPITRASFKVTGKGDKSIRGVLDDALRQAQTTQTVGPPIHPEDKAADIWGTIEAGLKTAGAHASDGEYNMQKLQSVKSLKGLLKNLAKSSDEQTAAMAAHYQDAIEIIEDAVDNQAPPLKTFSRFVYKPPKPDEDTASAFSVKKRGFVLPTNRIEKGRARLNPSESNEFHGDLYDVDLGDGAKMTYSPRGDTVGPRFGLAYEGTVDITIEDGISPKQYERVRSILKSLDIDIDPPTPEFEELLYIHKTVNQSDNANSKWTAIMEGAADDATKLKEAKQWVKDNMGVELPDKPNDWYRPYGHTATSFGDGHRQWERWDITPDDLKKNKMHEEFTLVHTIGSLSDSIPGRMPDILDKVLQSGGEMTSTVQRLRKGVNIVDTGGDSVGSDMISGGSVWFFTRLKRQAEIQRENIKGVFFKTRNVRRADAWHYPGDEYGRLTKAHIRARSLDQMKDYASESRNEFLFKESISLLDEVDVIRVDTKKRRQEIIDVFKKNKIEKLPDGRPVEEIVQTVKEDIKDANRKYNAHDFTDKDQD